jgi:hypothetical protein
MQVRCGRATPRLPWCCRQSPRAAVDPGSRRGRGKLLVPGKRALFQTSMSSAPGVARAKSSCPEERAIPNFDGHSTGCGRGKVLVPRKSDVSRSQVARACKFGVAGQRLVCPGVANKVLVPGKSARFQTSMGSAPGVAGAKSSCPGRARDSKLRWAQHRVWPRQRPRAPEERAIPNFDGHSTGCGRGKVLVPRKSDAAANSRRCRILRCGSGSPDRAQTGRPGRDFQNARVPGMRDAIANRARPHLKETTPSKTCNAIALQEPTISRPPT